MQEELGYDAVVTRDGGPMNEQLAKAAPEGIDVIVDMVGVNSSRRRLSWQGMGGVLRSARGCFSDHWIIWYSGYAI